MKGQFSTVPCESADTASLHSCYRIKLVWLGYITEGCFIQLRKSLSGRLK